jgi:hypothetical protein
MTPPDLGFNSGEVLDCSYNVLSRRSIIQTQFRVMLRRATSKLFKLSVVN